MLFLFFLTSGLFLGWSLGANDAANIFGSAVGSKMVSFRRAALIASVFVVIGSVFQGRGAAETLNSLGSVDALAGAFTVSLCAGITVLLMTQRSLPVSTSQAVVGAIIGWSLFTGNRTDLTVLSKIIGSWVTGPIFGGLFAALLYYLLRWFLRKAMIHAIKLDAIIRISLVVVGAFGAYSLGANNIANVIGVFVKSAPVIELHFGLFTMDGVQVLFFIGGLAIAAGIFTYSEKVMNKVGNGILSLTPEAAIVVVLAHSLVLFLFSSSAIANTLKLVGLPALPMVPVSSTQVVVGAVLGIGLVKGVREIRLNALGGIALGWLLTPLVSGAFTYVALFFVKNVFGQSVSAGIPEVLTGNVFAGDADSMNKVNLALPAIFIVAAFSIVALVILFFRQQKYRLKAENELLVQQNQVYQTQKKVTDLEVMAIHRENEMLNLKLEGKRREFTNIALNMTEQNEFLEKIANEISQALKEPDPAVSHQRMNKLLMLLKQKMSFAAEMPAFYGQLEQIHKDFRTKLNLRFPNLTDQEKRLATLIRLDLSSKEMATLMNIAPKSVEIARYRLRKKLGLDQGTNLNHFINSI